MSLGHPCETLVVSLSCVWRTQQPPVFTHSCLVLARPDCSFRFEPPSYLYQTPLSNVLTLPGSVAVPGQPAWHLLVRDGCRVTRCTYTAKKAPGMVFLPSMTRLQGSEATLGKYAGFCQYAAEAWDTK